MTKHERNVIERVMRILVNMPTGGIGEEGPTIKELDEYVREHGQPMEGDAVYHDAQYAFMLLHGLMEVHGK